MDTLCLLCSWYRQREYECQRAISKLGSIKLLDKLVGGVARDCQRQVFCGRRPDRVQTRCPTIRVAASRVNIWRHQRSQEARVPTDRQADAQLKNIMYPTTPCWRRHKRSIRQFCDNAKLKLSDPT